MKISNINKKKIIVFILIIICTFMIFAGLFIYNLLYGEHLAYGLTADAKIENNCVSIDFFNPSSATFISRITHEYIGDSVYISVFNSLDSSKRTGCSNTKVYLTENIKKIYVKTKNGFDEPIWQK